MSEAIILCGIPASGKSTLAKQFYDDYLILNQDALKKRSRVNHLFKAALEFRTKIIIDRCNHTKEQRDFFMKDLKKHMYKVDCIYYNPNLQVSLERNSKRAEDKIVPDFAIERFNKEFEVPELEEGFNEIICVD